MTNQEKEVLRGLVRKGYAVIVWTPEEIADADTFDLECACIRAGWDFLNSVAVEEVEQ